jgi:hypothetical protein
MLSLSDILPKLSGVHREALTWFEEKRGQRVSWSEMKEHANNGIRLSSAPKGIYKPAYTDFALSVRTMQDGPYPDKDVEYRPDGSWVCQYFQENSDPNVRDTYASNRGLMLCMGEKVPVGFLIRRRSKPRAEYDVLGVGFVTSWDDGYFTIEGLSDKGEFDPNGDADNAATNRTKLLGGETKEPQFQDFGDLREFQVRSVALRRGQTAFRNSLLAAYDSKCCLSGCDVVAALEAAHIAPYMGQHSNLVSNGLLLRADLHTLFDLGLFSFDDAYSVLLLVELESSDQYKWLKGKVMSLPDNFEEAPSVVALAKHRQWAGFYEA